LLCDLRNQCRAKPPEDAVDGTPESKGDAAGVYYGTQYGNFETELYSEIRREAFGEDIGQNSWLTAGEFDDFLVWLNLSSGKTVLDIACGSGGPALRMVARTGCSVVGIDLHDQAISIAKSIASRRRLNECAEFYVMNATEPLPFSNARFDAITCIDAINHFPNRSLVIAEWARLLTPGGRLLFTDPVTITGPLTSEEIAVRGSGGFLLFVPENYDTDVIAQSGLGLLVRRDVTANIAEVAERRRAARASRDSSLRGIEGDQAYQGQQGFLEVAARIAKEGRLSRFVYVAEKHA
jgi:2-polyprenyl-3-methyl-5-hydroxy-6-metoxy-1,4-benzoquinol methylase